MVFVGNTCRPRQTKVDAAGKRVQRSQQEVQLTSGLSQARRATLDVAFPLGKGPTLGAKLRLGLSMAQGWSGPCSSSAPAESCLPSQAQGSRSGAGNTGAAEHSPRYHKRARGEVDTNTAGWILSELPLLGDTLTNRISPKGPRASRGSGF